jgi:hypothetical protein
MVFVVLGRRARAPALRVGRGGGRRRAVTCRLAPFTAARPAGHRRRIHSGAGRPGDHAAVLAPRPSCPPTRWPSVSASRLPAARAMVRCARARRYAGRSTGAGQPAWGELAPCSASTGRLVTGLLVYPGPAEVLARVGRRPETPRQPRGRTASGRPSMTTGAARDRSRPASPGCSGGNARRRPPVRRPRAGEGSRRSRRPSPSGGPAAAARGNQPPTSADSSPTRASQCGDASRSTCSCSRS